MRNCITVAVVLFDQFNAIDVAGPLEVFAAVRRQDGTAAYRAELWSIAGRTVTSESGLTLLAEKRAPAKAAADLLIIPGGKGVRANETLSALASWIRRNNESFVRIAAVCTGAYALAEAGLLDRKMATTHWAHADDLRRKYPRIRVDANALFIGDGKVFTSGGVTAGIDLALHLVEQDFGAGAAMRVARELVVFLRRTGTQAQFSEPLKLQTGAAGRLSDVCLWVANNLHGDLSVESLARRANLSVRQFSRKFRAAFGVSPGAYVKSLRMHAARADLETGDAAIEQIAGLYGFESADGFRRAFESVFDIAPSQYQARFMRKGYGNEAS